MASTPLHEVARARKRSVNEEEDRRLSMARRRDGRRVAAAAVDGRGTSEVSDSREGSRGWLLVEEEKDVSATTDVGRLAANVKRIFFAMEVACYEKGELKIRPAKEMKREKRRGDAERSARVRRKGGIREKIRKVVPRGEAIAVLCGRVCRVARVRRRRGATARKRGRSKVGRGEGGKGREVHRESEVHSWPHRIRREMALDQPPGHSIFKTVLVPLHADAAT